MDSVDERVSVLVLRVSIGNECAPQDAQILITTVDRLPPIGEPAERHRETADSFEAAVDLVVAWLHGVVSQPSR